jgi:IS30 family transposase
MQMLTIAESAKLTGKHPDTIRRLIKRLLKEDGRDEKILYKSL